MGLTSYSIGGAGNRFLTPPFILSGGLHAD
jgi:hypothetical protein